MQSVGGWVRANDVDVATLGTKPAGSAASRPTSPRSPPLVSTAQIARSHQARAFLIPALHRLAPPARGRDRCCVESASPEVV